MHSIGGLSLNNIVCINLPFRQDRKKFMKKQAKKKKFPLTFFTARYNENDPERGRFQSHINVIKNAKRKGYRTILILEDDAKLWSNSLSIAPPPSDWKMLYLGGNVQRVIDDQYTNTSEIWKRVQCLTSHAYIIRYYMYNVILREARKYIGKMPLDEFYCEHIHPLYPTYLITPEHFTQQEGYSDVKKRNVTYNQILTKRIKRIKQGNDQSTDNDNVEDVEDVQEFDAVECDMYKDPDDPDAMKCVLKGEEIPDSELPFVTLVTPTCNRPGMIDFLIWSFYKQEYPEHKIQWIIADDSDMDKKVRDHLPNNDKRIKYINCKMGRGQYLPMSKKLNLCNSYANQGQDQDQIILHFFDFVLHNPKSTISRVKALLQNKEKQCVGCTDFGVFDFEKNRSYISYFPDADDHKTVMCLQSLGYWKSFWEARNFDETKLTIPAYFYLYNRMSKAVTMPYEFAMITLQATGLRNDGKKDKNSKEDSKIYQKNAFSFFDTWNRETKEFILLLNEIHRQD